MKITSTGPKYYSSGVMQEQSSNATTKRLTLDEMQRWRAQGLCLNCNELFTPGHRCLKPQLLETEEVEIEIMELGEKSIMHE